MAVNKVDVFGQTVIDLTEDTVTAEDLPEGVTAHDASGAKINGNAWWVPKMKSMDVNGWHWYRFAKFKSNTSIAVELHYRKNWYSSWPQAGGLYIAQDWASYGNLQAEFTKLYKTYLSGYVSQIRLISDPNENKTAYLDILYESGGENGLYITMAKLWPGAAEFEFLEEPILDPEVTEDQVYKSTRLTSDYDVKKPYVFQIGSNEDLEQYLNEIYNSMPNYSTIEVMFNVNVGGLNLAGGNWKTEICRTDIAYGYAIFKHYYNDTGVARVERSKNAGYWTAYAAKYE